MNSDGTIKSTPSSLVPQPLTCISAASDLSVWGIDPSGKTLQYTAESNTWQELPTPVIFSVVTVGNADMVCALDTQGNAYKYVPSSPTKWGDMAKVLAGISAGSDGAVWGVDSAGAIFRYVTDTNKWEPVSGTLSQISVGSSAFICGVNAENGSIWSYEVGTQPWHQRPGEMAQVSIGADGSLWAIDKSGSLFLYTGIDWSIAVGSWKQIAVGSMENIWGIDLQGNATMLSFGSSPQGEIPDNLSILFERLKEIISTKRWEAEAPFDETQSTHLWLVNRAAKLAGQYFHNIGDSNSDNLIQNVFIPQAGKIGDNGFHDNLCQGLYDADWKAEFSGPEYLFGKPSWAGHFYDPITHKNWLDDGYNTAYNNAFEHFEAAIQYYGEKNLSSAGYHLGLALHYFTDITQPMHSSNYVWQDSLPFGYHTGYELYVQTIQGQIPVPTDFMPLNPDFTHADYLIAAAKNSQLYLDAIKPNAFWMAPFHTSFNPELTDEMKKKVRETLPEIFKDAIHFTAQYIACWIELLQSHYGTGAKIIQTNSVYSIRAGNTLDGLLTVCGIRIPDRIFVYLMERLDAPGLFQDYWGATMYGLESTIQFAYISIGMFSDGNLGIFATTNNGELYYFPSLKNALTEDDKWKQANSSIQHKWTEPVVGHFCNAQLAVFDIGYTDTNGITNKSIITYLVESSSKAGELDKYVTTAEVNENSQLKTWVQIAVGNFSDALGRLVLFGVTSDGEIWYLPEDQENPGTFGSWQKTNNLGGRVFRQAAVGKFSNGKLVVFGIDDNQQLCYLAESNDLRGQFDPWEVTDNSYGDKSAEVVVGNLPNGLLVACVVGGGDKNLWYLPESTVSPGTFATWVQGDFTVHTNSYQTASGVFSTGQFIGLTIGSDSHLVRYQPYPKA